MHRNLTPVSALQNAVKKMLTNLKELPELNKIAQYLTACWNRSKKVIFEEKKKNLKIIAAGAIGSAFQKNLKELAKSAPQIV